MTKPNSEVNQNHVFLLTASCLVLILILVFLNLSSFFTHPQPQQVLSAQIEDVDEESFWISFLNSNPDYFPGYLELAELQLAKGLKNQARDTLNKAGVLNPNSLQLKNLLNQLE